MTTNGTWVGRRAGKQPAGAVLVGAALWSLMPLIFYMAARATSTFFFFVAFQALWGAVLHYAARREARLLETKPTISSILRNNISHHGRTKALSTFLAMTLVTILAGLDWLMFGLASERIGPIVATVLLESYPTLAILMLVLASRKERDQKRQPATLRSGQILLIAVAVVGVTLTIFSQSSSFPGIGELDSTGVMFGACSAVMSAASVAVPIWISRALFGSSDDSAKDDGQSGLLTSVTLAIKSRQAIVVSFLAVPFAIATTSARTQLLPVIALSAIAALLMGVADWFIYAANQSAKEQPWINAVSKAKPVFAVLLVALLLDQQISRPAWLALGLTSVIVANLLLNLDPEGTYSEDNAVEQSYRKVRGWAYRSLVLSVLGAGAFMYFRDDWLPTSLQAWSYQEYWGVVGLCATVFVLILSFRTNQIAERNRLEDELMLDVHREAEYYLRARIFARCPEAGSDRRCRSVTQDADNDDEVARDRRSAEANESETVPTETLAPDISGSSCDILHHLQEGNQTTNITEMVTHYLAAQQTVQAAISVAADPEHGQNQIHRDLWAYQAKLDKLVNLRQGGREFAGSVSIFTFGFVTVFAALFLRPFSTGGSPSPWNGFATEMIGMLIVAAVSFLIFSHLDSQGARDAAVVRDLGGPQKIQLGHDTSWGLYFSLYTDVTTHRWVSSVLLMSVAAVMAWVLHFKWF